MLLKQQKMKTDNDLLCIGITFSHDALLPEHETVAMTTCKWGGNGMVQNNFWLWMEVDKMFYTCIFVKLHVYWFIVEVLWLWYHHSFGSYFNGSFDRMERISYKLYCYVMCNIYEGSILQ